MIPAGAPGFWRARWSAARWRRSACKMAARRRSWSFLDFRPGGIPAGTGALRLVEPAAGAVPRVRGADAETGRTGQPDPPSLRCSAGLIFWEEGLSFQGREILLGGKAYRAAGISVSLSLSGEELVSVGRKSPLPCGTRGSNTRWSWRGFKTPLVWREWRCLPRRLERRAIRGAGGNGWSLQQGRRSSLPQTGKKWRRRHEGREK